MSRKKPGDWSIKIKTKRPCSWRYRKCEDFPEYCDDCMHNPKVYNKYHKKPEKSMSYYDPVGSYYH